jgi:hypothetical protein
MKYIQVSRSDCTGSYTVEFDNLDNTIQAELLLEDNEAGISVILTIVEMSEDEFSKLEEFTGW